MSSTIDPRLPIGVCFGGRQRVYKRIGVDKWQIVAGKHASRIGIWHGSERAAIGAFLGPDSAYRRLEGEELLDILLSGEFNE